jgi:hypothetical protein
VAFVDELTSYWCGSVDGEWRIVAAEAGQIGECRVDGISVVVVMAHALLADERESLVRAARARFPDAALLVWLDDVEGCVRVDDSLCGDERRRHPAFLAAAAIKRFWGWDDSERIRVESDTLALEIRVSFDGSRRIAEIA